jgi:2-phospho-L-lactate/phosphoenolpyruvate guanylyltransferase
VSTFALVPVKDLRGTKSRLSPLLDASGRAGLTLYMMGRVVNALREAEVETVCVASPDRVVLEAALEAGAEPLFVAGAGLNPDLEEGRRLALKRGASSLLILPADLPLLQASDARAVLGAGRETGVVIHSDAAGEGTNALLLNPPDTIPLAFGPGSFRAHLGAARTRGLAVAVLERPRLAFDLDTGEDLARLREGTPS